MLIDLADEVGADYLVVAAVNAVGFAIGNWDELALDDFQVRQAAVELADRMAEGMVCGVGINFFTPALQRYLREKLGYGDILTTPYLDEGSLFECYIQSDGRVFPSQKISEIHPVSLRRARDFGIEFQRNGLLNASLSEIWSGDEFERYRALILRNEHVRGYKTCSSCVFSRSYCRPSPVSYLLGDSVPKSICTTVPLTEAV